MARPLRLEFPGALYHVTSRGNHGEFVFADDDDRRRFLDILSATVRRFNWVCHAYCLMGNHYHLVIETPDGNLARGMRQVGSVYTQAYNRRHTKCGHLFQGRYKAILVEKESHLLEVVRYVLLNPVRAGMTQSPEAWPWSSYRGTCGMSEVPPCLTIDWILGNFGPKRSVAVSRLRDFVCDGMKTESPWEKVRGQVVLGGKDFFAEIEPYLQGREEIREIPVPQRLAGRPELRELFEAIAPKMRNGKIAEAVNRWGYSQKEVADFLRLHYSSVSRILSRTGEKEQE